MASGEGKTEMCFLKERPASKAKYFLEKGAAGSVASREGKNRDVFFEGKASFQGKVFFRKKEQPVQWQVEKGKKQREGENENIV